MPLNYVKETVSAKLVLFEVVDLDHSIQAWLAWNIFKLENGAFMLTKEKIVI